MKTLRLKKEVIAKLQNDEMRRVQGGTGCTTSATCGHEQSVASCLCQVTAGDCDMPTIGHDDGPNCVSKSDWGWCWCYGRG
ncbi:MULTISPECIES: class I lanthipeptide [Parabacteroides]|uniref:class I lanthipeptide n=1 Tax=Parabacteroides TaxID=375288 RepID=UPI00117CF38A|nr:class I lanthipeptide [Parabacteroides provencensis]